MTRPAGGFAAAGLALTGLLALPSAPSVATTATGASAVSCTNADLAASYRNTGAGMSHRYGNLIVTNTSDHACTTGGYSGLSYVGHGNGTQIGAAADRDPTGPKAKPIVLAPGDRAVSRVAETSYAPYPRHRCRPTPVNGLRVYLPNETKSQYIKHPTTGCANPRVHLLSVQAFR